MAFQSPTQARRAQHQLPPTPRQDSTSTLNASNLTRSTAADPAEEWVVFSPSTLGTGTHLSRASETCSFLTESAVENIYEEEETEDSGSTETDSLQAFTANAVRFPAHDGLGTFAPSHRSLEASLKLVEASSHRGDKTARIQRWREEQSEAFVNEIERATRSLGTREREAEIATLGEPAKQEEAHSESFWKRITRSFIRDIIGIDDTLLEVLFGEALPAEALEESGWRRSVEEKLLDRITAELGELVQLYASPPATQPSKSLPTASTPVPSQLTATATAASTTSSLPAIPFAPTLAKSPSEDATHAALWGIEDPELSQVDAQLKKEYWEQDLDMRLVFSYVKSHFTRRPNATAPSPPVSEAETVQLRYQHPLVNRRRAPSVAMSVKSKSSRRGSYYWDVATSVGSGKSSCLGGTGMWAAV